MGYSASAGYHSKAGFGIALLNETFPAAFIAESGLARDIPIPNNPEWSAMVREAAVQLPYTKVYLESSPLFAWRRAALHDAPVGDYFVCFLQLDLTGEESLAMFEFAD